MNDQSDKESDFLNAIENDSEENEYTKCNWYQKKMEDVKKFPEKNPDYTIINEKLLKHAPEKSMTDDDWLLCVPKPMRERVLIENHSTPTSGHLDNRIRHAGDTELEQGYTSFRDTL